MLKRSNYNPPGFWHHFPITFKFSPGGVARTAWRQRIIVTIFCFQQWRQRVQHEMDLAMHIYRMMLIPGGHVTTGNIVVNIKHKETHRRRFYFGITSKNKWFHWYNPPRLWNRFPITVQEYWKILAGEPFNNSMIRCISEAGQSEKQCNA